MTAILDDPEADVVLLEAVRHHGGAFSAEQLMQELRAYRRQPLSAVARWIVERDGVLS